MQLATTTCVYWAGGTSYVTGASATSFECTTETEQATTTQSVINGFTYGEVLIVLVLLMIFTQAFFSELKKWIFGVRIENPTRNKYNKDI